jgi:hypothetical protein
VRSIWDVATGVAMTLPGIVGEVESLPTRVPTVKSFVAEYTKDVTLKKVLTKRKNTAPTIFKFIDIFYILYQVL